MVKFFIKTRLSTFLYSWSQRPFLHLWCQKCGSYLFKLVSLTWFLRALRSFRRFTLHYRHAVCTEPLRHLAIKRVKPNEVIEVLQPDKPDTPLRVCNIESRELPLPEHIISFIICFRIPFSYLSFLHYHTESINKNYNRLKESKT